MPFTFSHPAIVMPLSKSRVGLSATGLVVGSMVPDFEFIVRMKTGENIGHHWTGIFLFDLPMAFLLCFAFHQYVRAGLLQHLPTWYRVRFSRFVHINWIAYAKANPLRVLVSIGVGIGSHLFLDAFTHSNGLFVSLMPILQDSVYLFQQRLPVYLVLQLVSSVWGLWLVQGFIARMPVAEVPATPDYHTYWIAIVLSACGIALIRLLALTEAQTFWDVVFAGMGSVFYALLGVSIVRTVWNQATWLAR